MPTINRLSQSIINKIAAGEVIERPASVAKEVMENAVDAGASRIDLSVEKGGIDLIRVVDDGCGMTPDQLPLALASHATSKLETADDLFHVSTMGFRGEALASIGEVSHLILRSKTPGEAAGAQIEVRGGKTSDVEPCGCPTGTAIEIRDLFFNTPVRRKFMRSTQTEFGHISEAFARIAMANPEIHCVLRHNNREVHDLPAGKGLLDRIAGLFGRDIAEHLIWVESQNGSARLSGYVAHPKISRSNARMQYLFLNGRYIRDRSLQHALREAYRGLLTVGRQPIAFLVLEIPLEDVDVNVHPTKLEVRFQDSGRLYSQLLATLRTAFLGSNLNTRVDASAQSGPMTEEAEGGARSELLDWAKCELSSPGPAGADRPSAPAENRPDQSQMDFGTPQSERSPLEFNTIRRDAFSGVTTPRAVPRASASPGTGPPMAPAFPSRSRAVQIHNRYLITESEDGVLVIDQHALHERVLFETLKSRFESRDVEIQTLLVPRTIDLAPIEYAAVMENRDLLEEIGLTVEPFGGETVSITGYPALFQQVDPVEILRSALDRLLEGKGKLAKYDIIESMLHSMACKAAVKAGDPLEPAEIDALLEQRELVNDAHHCPHGRPTALVFTREELDKQFRRT